MQPEVPTSLSPDNSKGLPPVTPPSGKFIAQLFLVPGLIVVVAVSILWGFTWLVGASRTPDQFIKNLDNANTEVRWRAADDLAQVLLRDDRLASDPKLALNLADRVLQTLRRQQSSDKDSKFSKTSSAEKSKDADRNFVIYLGACLGNFMVPVGAPLLREMAVDDKGHDSQMTARKRWQAIWALANLGQNIRRFDKLVPEQQNSILGVLEQETFSPNGERAQWAKSTLACLKGRQTHEYQAMGVAEALAHCARDPNPFLREITTFALNFWEGTASENALMEQTLSDLSRDSGSGEDILSQFYNDEDLDSRSITRIPGLKIRYNAAVALARRGSTKTPLPLLQDMLDENTQLENFRLKEKDGREGPDETVARTTIVNAVKAVVDLHSHKPDLDLSSLKPSLEKLMKSSQALIRIEAERTLNALGKK